MHSAFLLNHALVPWLGILLILVGPPVLFVAVIHLLERISQRHLAERFGWGCVMVTGWLGTPVHELSHVAMCLVFRHRVDRVALFEPDPVSGRLGFVQHSWRKGNWFEELGNVFVGLAPLAGGSAALLLLLLLFYPNSYGPVTAGNDMANPTVPSAIMAAVSDVCAVVLRPGNLLTIKFWVFVYLVLCISSHMAPSWSDYRGSGRGAIVLALVAVIAIPVSASFITEPFQFQNTIATILSPLLALFAMAIVLCAVSTFAIVTLTSGFPRRFEVRRVKVCP